jgi:hypothetical protein
VHVGEPPLPHEDAQRRGKFRIEGEMSIEQRRLRGTIRLGLTREYLDWLPNPEEVFSRKQDGYLWTNVHLSGTIDDPGQDLSPRIIELFKLASLWISSVINHPV